MKDGFYDIEPCRLNCAAHTGYSKNLDWSRLKRKSKKFLTRTRHFGCTRYGPEMSGKILIYSSLSQLSTGGTTELPRAIVGKQIRQWRVATIACHHDNDLEKVHLFLVAGHQHFICMFSLLPSLNDPQ